MLQLTKNFAILVGLSMLAGLAFEVSAQQPLPKAKGVNDALPDPDGKPADVSKTVKVFILMGQSNMLEMGKVAGDKDGTLEHAVKTESMYPFLIDDAGKWTTRQDVRNVAVMGSGGPGKTQVRVNNLLTVGSKIGVEQGIGHHLGNALEEPVLILKSAIGNRSLGWDLLPPDSPSYEFKDPKDDKTYVYAGYGQSPDRWVKGTEPVRPSAGKPVFSTTATSPAPRKCWTISASTTLARRSMRWSASSGGRATRTATMPVTP